MLYTYATVGIFVGTPFRNRWLWWAGSSKIQNPKPIEINQVEQLFVIEQQ
jgi:hypothetical protein